MSLGKEVLIRTLIPCTLDQQRKYALFQSWELKLMSVERTNH